MAITFVDDTADAEQTEFLFNFPYLEDEHVAVFIDGVRQTIGSDEDYTVQTSPSKRIVLNVEATGGEIVRVRRISDPATDLVDFQNGSVLTESELDRSYLHNRYLAEESAEQNDISLRVQAGADDQFDALNKKIINVSDPTADQDAATKNYVDGVVGDVAVGALPDNSVTYGKIQEAAANNVLLGNDNGVNSDIQELSATEVRTMLNIADGANNYTHPNHTGDVTSTGDGATVIASGAVTSDKISTTDTNFNVTAVGKVGIGKVNSGSYQLEVDGDILINDTGDNFPAAVFAGSAGAAIQLNDQSTNGQIFNLSSNPEGVGGPGNFGIGSIDGNDYSAPTLTITNVTTTTDEATYTFSSAHNIKQGERVQTFGSSDADWNTTSTVLSVGSTTQLTVTRPSATTNYPTTAKKVGSYVTFSVRKDYEANVMYTFLKANQLPKATSEPAWLENGQVWIDTTDMSLKIKDYA